MLPVYARIRNSSSRVITEALYYAIGKLLFIDLRYLHFGAQRTFQHGGQKEGTKSKFIGGARKMGFVLTMYVAVIIFPANHLPWSAR